MKALELKRILNQLPDDTEILIESQMSENEGEFLKTDGAYAGFCDPDDDRVDGMYVELQWVSDTGTGVTRLPATTNPNSFPVVALTLEKTSPRSIYMEN